MLIWLKSANKKGKKVSKTEKERLQREEEERKCREEEETFLASAQAEQERLEREQKIEEERLKLELKDRERREVELNELQSILEEKQNAVNTWEDASREKAKWDRYMNCDGSPNPIVQSEINTFISLWKEDPKVQIQPVLKQCALALRLIDELELHLSGEKQPSVVQMYQDTLLTLQQLIHGNLQLATEEILKCSKSYFDIDTSNMQMIVQDDNVTLCMWANLNKNPRFKGYTFKEVGLGFELPKELAVSGIAVRFLHTHYDHLSHLSCCAQVKNKKPNREIVGPDFPLIEDPNSLIGAEMKRKHDWQGRPEKMEDDLQSVKSEGKKSAISLLSDKGERRSASLSHGEDGEGHSESITTFGEGTDEADEADSTPAVVEPVSTHAEVHIVDLQQYTPLGGVFYFDLFHLPPQSHTAKSWEIREIRDSGLQVFTYPPEQSQVQSSISEEEKSNTHSSSPVGVTVVLPDSVIFLEEPQVARWDPIGHHWRTDHITEIAYNGELRSISFKMDSFYAFTLLQETHANMPFQCWELRPLGQDSVMLTITAALTEVNITVKGNQCMLQMDQALALTSILGKWMSLPTLQRAMKHAGVNIFINEFSEKYVMAIDKDPLIEHVLYEQMALMSSAFAFSWSKWNAQCGQDHLILQVREHLEEGAVPENAWSLYLLGAQRSRCLKMTEESSSFSPEMAEETEFHSTFVHMLRDTMSPEGQHRVEHAHHLFVDTVERLLCSTRVLTFS